MTVRRGTWTQWAPTRRPVPDGIRSAFVVAVTVGIVAVAAVEASAQASCDVGAANRAYQAGRFAQAVELLAACAHASVEQGVVAHLILAKAYLAQDSVGAARAELASLLRLRPNFQANPLTDSERFRRVLDETRATRQATLVSSVSKTAEDLREAPASVVVLTGDEIRRRGYLDLEAVLHDLPGFDISRGDGFLYAGIYQRGYRSIETNRTLLLIDGVEENDVFGNTVWLSRQYPLSNVERVEVVYGPATTIYGANAFLGVVNVITKDPQSLRAEKDVRMDFRLHGGAGETFSADATLGGRIPGQPVTWSVTGRMFRSEGRDLSAFPDWDYDPRIYDDVDYESLLHLTDPASIDAFISEMGAPTAGFPDCSSDPACTFRIDRDDEGVIRAVALTAAGADSARARDKRALAQEVNGRPVGFSNPTRDWAVNAKLRIDDLLLGAQMWSRNESTSPWRPDQLTPGGDNGARWIPGSTSMYAKFERPLGEQFTLTVFSRFKIHRLDGRSSTFSLDNYARSKLGLADLAARVDPNWRQTYNARSNSQVRNEITLSWLPRTDLSVVAGLEARNSSVGATTISSSRPNPSETGSPGPGVEGGNQINSRDLGMYMQASMRASPNVKLVAGARLDNNRIRDGGGYGTVFNPRLALVGTRDRLVMKVIYAEAFQDPPNFQKYQTFGSRERANPGLRPERVRNLELNLGWLIQDSASVDVSAYWADYSDIVQEALDTACVSCVTDRPTRFQNVGARRIRGLQASGIWRRDGFTVSGNYTFTDPLQKETDLRVRDIASHRLNLSVSADLGGSWRANLRSNLVGPRQTGSGTTAGLDQPRSTDAYAVVHASLTRAWRGLDVQLTANNLFDAEYAHPGVRTADGVNFVMVHPQPRRSLYLQVSHRR